LKEGGKRGGLSCLSAAGERKVSCLFKRESRSIGWGERREEVSRSQCRGERVSKKSSRPRWGKNRQSSYYLHLPTHEKGKAPFFFFLLRGKGKRSRSALLGGEGKGRGGKPLHLAEISRNRVGRGDSHQHNYYYEKKGKNRARIYFLEKEGGKRETRKHVSSSAHLILKKKRYLS